MSLHVVTTTDGIAVVEHIAGGSTVRLPPMPVVKARALALDILKACNSAAPDAMVDEGLRSADLYGGGLIA